MNDQSDGRLSSMLILQINVIYKVEVFKIYFYTLVSSKLIVSKEKDLGSIVKSAINSSTWHAAIVENFGSGRKNNMKNSLMSLNWLSSAFQIPCAILVTSCKHKVCRNRSSSVLSGENTKDKEERLEQLASPASQKGSMADMIKSHEVIPR